MVFFTRFGRVFGDRQAGNRRHQHRDAARLAELEGGGGVLVDEGRLDRRFVGRMLVDHALQTVVDGESSRTARSARSSVASEPQATKLRRLPSIVDHAPAGAAEPRIDAEDANRATHDRPLIALAAMRA